MSPQGSIAHRVPALRRQRRNTVECLPHAGQYILEGTHAEETKKIQSSVPATQYTIAQELSGSRGGRPGLPSPSLIVLNTVSVGIRQ